MERVISLRDRSQKPTAIPENMTGEITQTDRSAKHTRKVFIVSGIRVPHGFCTVELYSQLAGNAFPPHWEYVPNMQGTRSQGSGNIRGKISCRSRGFYLRELSGAGRRTAAPLTPVNERTCRVRHVTVGRLVSFPSFLLLSACLGIKPALPPVGKTLHPL